MKLLSRRRETNTLIVLLTLTLLVTHVEGVPKFGSNRAHDDADWQDVCRDAIGCHLTQGDMAPGQKAEHQNAAQGISTYFDMGLLKKAMAHLRQFMDSSNTPDQKDDSKYTPLRDELSAVGFIFYPQNYEELTQMQSGQQKLLKLVKASKCEADAFKCAGSLAKEVNPKGPDTRCGFSWGAITYARFNCSNIAKWPPAIKKVLDYPRLHCPALRAANCPDLLDRGGGAGRAPQIRPEVRGRGGGSVVELPPDIAAQNAENVAAAQREADDPKCAQLTREYKSPTTSTSPFFGELACGTLRSAFDGWNMDAHARVNERSNWIHRKIGLGRAQKEDDWGDWRKCPPGAYATSVTSTLNGKGLQELHMSCSQPRFANETDEQICNGPLTGVKVAAKYPEEGGPNYVLRFAAGCASSPSGWVYDFKERPQDEVRCPDKKVVCAYRLFKGTSDGNTDELKNKGDTYRDELAAEGQYVFDIQLYCCSLEYPCTPGDMYVIDPALDGDYSDAEPQKLSRMFVTGVDKGLSSSVGGSGSSKWEVAIEGTIGFAGDAVKAGVTATGSYSKTHGHNWKQDSSMTKSESTRLNVDYMYPEGLYTRYFRPLATCGVGRLLSGDTPFAVSFVNPARCVLSEGWTYVTVVHAGAGAGATATFNVGINFTTPALTFVTGPPFLEHKEISAGLEKRLVGEYAIKSGGAPPPTVHSSVPPWSSAPIEPEFVHTPEWVWDPEQRRYFRDPAAPSTTRAPGSPVNPADVPPILVDGVWKKYVEGQGYVEVSAPETRRRGIARVGAHAERRSGMMIRVERRSGELPHPPGRPEYLGELHEKQVPISGVSGNNTAAVFQRLVRCSSPRKPGEYILVHSDEPKVLVLPQVWPSSDPSDEYVLVKNGKYDSWKDPGKFKYTLRLGVVWPAIEGMKFTPRAVDLGLKALLADKFAKIKEGAGAGGSKNGYNWARNEQWKVWSADAGIVKEVVVGQGEEVAIHQMVGSYKDYKIYTDHIETVVRDLSNHECKEGTGIFKCDAQNGG